jgi:hypothetical protein
VSTITEEDLQEISKFTNLLPEHIHIQTLNMEVLNMLREESKRPGGREKSDKDFSCKYRALGWAIESILSETKLLCSHAKLILNLIDNAIAMVSGVDLS